jgi:sulfatase maturation enzyme AslB (radical SAM superfamily)
MPYCIQPFINIRIDSGPEYKPCCHYKEPMPAQSISQYLASTELQELKQHLQSEKPLPLGCRLCANQELKGQPSFRQRYNHFFQSDNRSKIIHLEILVNNTCNLKCFMCDPTYSTALGSERRTLGWIESYPVINHNQQVQEALEQLSDLESVSFIGGEFFFAKENILLLEKAIERKLKINIVTNATILLPTQLALLKQAAHVDIQVSLDGIESSYNFMRYPAQWDTVQANIVMLKKTLPNQHIHVNTVVQPLNIQYIAALMEWCNKNRLQTVLVNLQAPSWLEWRILTADEKQVIADILDQHCVQYQLTTAQKNMLSQFKLTMGSVNYNQDFRKDFVKKMQSILTLRNIPAETVTKHLGELTDLAKDIIKET